MKVLQLAALFGGAVFAVSPLNVRNGVRRDVDGTTTAVVFVTSMYTYTTLCSNAKDCPASATVVLTSTTVVATTTTICSTLGAVLPSYEVSSSSITSSALPNAPGSSTAIPTSSIAASISPQSSGPGFSISIIPGSSIDVPPSPSASGSLPVISGTPPVPGLSYVFPSISLTPSAPMSGTLSSGVQNPVLSSSGSSATDVTSISFSYPTTPSSDYASSPTVPSNTNTDATRISFPVTSSESSSAAPSLSGGYIPPSGSWMIPSDTNTVPVPTSDIISSTGPSSAGPSSSADATYVTGSSSAVDTSGPSSGGHSRSSTPVPGSIVSATHATLRSTTSGGYSPPTPPAGSESISDSTVRVTSYLTQTMTSFITAPVVSSRPNSSDIEATYTMFSSSVSALPSGSGYSISSGIVNGTVVSPKPTYSEVPVNMGLVVGAGKSSIAAIVVALAFAHFA